MTTISLDGSGWRLKSALPGRWHDPELPAAALADARDWFPASVPGSVQDDLWKAGLIEDPYVGRNTLAAEWAAERTWVYEISFEGAVEWRGRGAHLRFAGVDYAARFLLNGVLLGEHESMTTSAVFDVTEALDPVGINSLVVVLAPAPAEQDQLGRTSLVRSRKSRMGYWWDFCPRLINLGLVGSVTLELHDGVRIDDVAVSTDLSGDGRSCGVTVEVSLQAFASTTGQVLVDLTREDAPIASAAAAVTLTAGEIAVARLEQRIQDPELWWPNGRGAQPLYRATARFVPGPVDDAPADALAPDVAAASTSFGMRTVELAPNETGDPTAPPYTFVINGERTYITGWNWVPLDALYGPRRTEKLKHLLHLAAAAHCNLLRVNGVGLLESDEFYDECDRLGIMVWQEFLLTSSATDRKPSEDPEYVAAVVAEARRMVPQRRNHPSLVLWCAGNELESLDKLPLDDTEPVIAALKQVATELDPDTVWLPTSARGRKPFNGLASIRRDPDGLHDVHGPWLYEGLTAQYELYNAGTSLFHSELGGEGITNPETLRAVLPAEEWSLDRTESPAWRHLSAWWVRRKEWEEIFGPVEDLDRLIAATQLLQAEGVRYGLESNRRRAWRNSGSLPWQFNEPYPMIGSTAAVDYYGRPKALYHAIAEAYRPLAVSARYETVAWGGRENFGVGLWVANAGRERLDGVSLRARVLAADGAIREELHVPGSVAADGSTRMGDISSSLSDLPGELFFLDIALEAADGAVLAHSRLAFSAAPSLAPLLALPDVVLETDWRKRGDSGEVTLANRGSVPALGVRISDARPVHELSQLLPAANFLALLPGESTTVPVSGIDAGTRVAISGLNVVYREVPSAG